jgi:hypothetical protein
MGDDPTLTEWLDHFVRQTEEHMDLEADDPLRQARQLLNAWADQTESFQPTPRPAAAPKRPRLAQYRKLDAPMMVAKKQTMRPSVDPTLIMEARLARVREMKAQRLERVALKPEPEPKSRIARRVDVPDVDSEIRAHRERVANRLREKQQELEDRTRRSAKIRIIEEKVAESIAKETEAKLQAERNELDDESLRMRLQLLFRKQIIRRERQFFVSWASRSHFQSKAFQRAAVFGNFRRLSAAFSRWRARLRQVLHDREMLQLERELRREKQCEDTATRVYARKLAFKAMTRWRFRFRAALEKRVADEQHQKRRDVLVSRIVVQLESPRESPGKRQSPKIPKVKAAPVKTDPKFEAMAKRMEEQKAKRIEKAQREAEAAQAQEEEKIARDIEAQRKKRLEHRQFLETEKQKREDQQRRQIEYEKMIARKKYCEIASQKFRRHRLKLNEFRTWSMILLIRAQLNSRSEKHYQTHLQKAGFSALKWHCRSQQGDRDLAAQEFCQFRFLRARFLAWVEVRNRTWELQEQVAHVSDVARMRRVWRLMHEVRKKRRKARYVVAARHFDRFILRKCFKHWPVGCAVAREEDTRECARADLLSKALQYLDELSSDGD